MNMCIRTLAQTRAWDIWVYYSQRVITKIKVCQDKEWRILNERIHYKKFLAEQQRRLIEIDHLIGHLEELDNKYKLGKGDCTEKWKKQSTELYYFISQI